MSHTNATPSHEHRSRRPPPDRKAKPKDAAPPPDSKPTSAPAPLEQTLHGAGQPPPPDSEGRPALTEDAEEIAQESAHIPDRDQVFDAMDVPPQAHPTPEDEQRVGGTEEPGIKGAVDVDEGEWGRISDPAFAQEGALKAQRAYMGDRGIEKLNIPAAYAGIGANDDPRGISHLTRDEIYRRAQALNIPGRSRMTKLQLAEAVAEALSGKLVGPE